MSLAALQLAARCRQCSGTMRLLRQTPQRPFHHSAAVLARREKKPPALSKKQLAAKERKRAKKAPKNIYDSEKMTLTDAVEVLRAVEVASPNATYELVVKTEMGKGSTIPKGRFDLPRQTKEQTKDRILVFAEGRQAEEAKRAGADIVGGLELVEGIISGRHQATMFLCSRALIRPITPRLGRVLGPRGLMPSERRGTVTDDIAGYIRRLKGTSEWKGDKEGTIRQPIAKMYFPVTDVVKNIRYFLGVVKRATGNVRDPQVDSNKKETSQKPVNAITRVLLSTQQGPSIQIADA
ncbi:ribosomal protein L1 [Dichomitus squalens]|uniref:Ribosomal protein n=1 Tax=Dichomitus squalens TaxID=114155 RepID=A0A4Q9Q4H1_9APHY|nr:ribosomal protein L1 [Dichomitus squalens LYAD-421 SS1]EJF67106.1 ribosomal protein L1 [Dichomitus squalens LYAD-421 SS1]TBU34444.1 ribosomal protein L1 [Dichomitus squalens]TBU50048.1 ribosomal protein L1 [Dichomitus squalens]TBU62115.1 ribosomal protein L1 [Dichomitus squalens]